ncbi:hypothetical protein K2173_016908 [Erythroxylum novogranatense]|uniref:Uncharacterized protein n=1 Tax=Erythroxylum novogranatense TaxID=1862640 RepID=A0AAV8U570_9ROSI|nr:hypothetical protein K2173_016908 [Erythroxylum novogranatense]
MLSLLVRKVQGADMQNPLRTKKGGAGLVEDRIQPKSSSSGRTNKHVVVVMDGLKEFNAEPLQWALENVTSAGCRVTLLGAMPWLNIPLSTKTLQDVWYGEFEELSASNENGELRRDARYQKLQAVLDLCQTFGVVPQKEIVMGFPLRTLVVEKITNLHATWVVFDRYQRKYREFFAEKIQCNMVMMNESGEADVIRGKSKIGMTEGESPAS